MIFLIPEVAVLPFYVGQYSLWKSKLAPLLNGHAVHEEEGSLRNN